jgi:hypothetical protein
MTLKRDHLTPGACISCDHFVSATKARRVDGFGRNTHHSGYEGGAIYVDHASGKVFCHLQSSLDAADTIRGKQILEKDAQDCGHRVLKYHSDNGIFASAEFRDHCDKLNQDLSFSGVGAHHQNGVAERAIGTVCCLARANLIHMMLCWPDKCNINLWGLALLYAVWIHNRIPKDSLGGLSPEEVWTRVHSDHADLRRAHVFGCPVYVLEADLQDGQRIPKWNSRARVGVFVGFSNEHSSLVPLVLNPKTGHISPQYHVIFDDKFETVPSLHPSTDSIDENFAKLFHTSRDFYLDPTKNDDGVQLPKLLSDWNNSLHSPDSASSEGVPQHSSATPEGDDFSSNPASEGVGTDVDSKGVSRYPRRSSRNASPVYLMLPMAHALLSWAQPPAAFANAARDQSVYHAATRVTFEQLDDLQLLHSPWSDVASAFSAGIGGRSLSLLWNDDYGMKMSDAQTARVNSLLEPDLSPLEDVHGTTLSGMQPHAFAAKASANSEDNPSYDEAMKGPHAREYYQAAKVELSTLQDDLDCWELVPHCPDMNVLPSTWAFKCKRFPDGRVKKFKARFCARGDRQKEGIDFFETWSPVVQWTTVRIMMILSVILNLETHQADITAAFVHATLPPEEEVYIHQPRGFIQPGTSTKSHVLKKLRRALYGLKQAPRHFFKYLATHIQQHGLKQSAYDPCLFIGSDVIVVVYVDDLLIYAKSEKSIDRLIADLKEDGIWIHKEDSAAGFLGVDISRSQDCLTLTQSGLIQRIISALGLHSPYSTSKDTPAERNPLPKDSNGTPADGIINYASVVGMLLYLSGHTRPDIAFAVHQCARYTFNPTERHVNALKRIGRYLKGTSDKGLIMRPSKHLHVDCYPDSDFAGLYNHEDVQDPHCVRSRAGYVILLSCCPVLWASQLISTLCLSTMEAEYVSLSKAYKDLFPLLDQIKELGHAVGLPVEEYTNLHTTVYEDNVGALSLLPNKNPSE